MSIAGYTRTYVCRDCGAEHGYRPQAGCQRCRSQRLKPVDAGKRPPNLKRKR